MAQLNHNKVNYIAIHCSATPPTSDIGAKEIDVWHRQRGFAKIGYHLVIRRDGTLEYGRLLEGWNGASESEVGAHVSNFNSQAVGVCLVGGITKTGKSENNYTDAQWDTLSGVITELHEQFPTATIQGHRDFPKVAKDCPCFDAKKWWANLQR